MDTLTENDRKNIERIQAKLKSIRDQLDKNTRCPLDTEATCKDMELLLQYIERLDEYIKKRDNKPGEWVCE